MNADIVDIALAPKNAHGKVIYSADFQILRPIDLSKGNHRVIFELPNRGRTNILGILNDSTTPNDTTKSGDPGNGFVMNQGYTIVEGGWDTLKLRTAVRALHSDLSRPQSTRTALRSPAGRPRSSSLTPARLRGSEPSTYPAATADKSKAFLTVRQNYADTPQPVPSSDWDYTDATLTAVKLTSGDFGGQGAFPPPALYEFTYIAKDPIVVGLGFALAA